MRKLQQDSVEKILVKQKTNLLSASLGQRAEFSPELEVLHETFILQGKQAKGLIHIVKATCLRSDPSV